ncbi:MAG: TraR/DksA C4-type zinc finger protein [Patescibacteria group bacterium]
MKLFEENTGTERIRRDDLGPEIQAAMVASVTQASPDDEPNVQGICQDCDQPIEAKRLRALPTARRCISCAETREMRLGNVNPRSHRTKTPMFPRFAR